MSEFKKAVAALEPLEAELAAVEGETADPVAHLQRIELLSASLEEQGPLWTKFHKRAIETDEDKQVYGEKMTARVLEGWNRYQTTVSTTNELLETSQATAAPEIARREQQRQFEESAARQRQAEREACDADETIRAKEAAAAVASALEQQQREDLEQLMKKETREREQRRNAQEMLDLRRAKLLALSPAAGVRLAVTQLHSACANPSDFTAAIRTLLSVLAKCVGSPDEKNHRRLRVQNPNFQQDLARFDWAVECLMAAGFKEQVEPSEAAGAVEEQFLICHEPDPVNRYGQWKQWLGQMKAVKGVLAAVDSVLRDHRLAGTTDQFTLETAFRLVAQVSTQEEAAAVAK